ncbi:MAG: class II aldolase/adducin family protein [Zoogloeaceae bacterium]|jgi:L-fuculose-phosphate aldolase|nr:class II aldolase/adducin family protein [Zoogloeaceae bacterium]
MDELAAKRALIAAAQAMSAAGLNKGTAGNLSCRDCLNNREGFFITPTGMDYAILRPEDIPWVDLYSEGEAAITEGRRPSSEWRIHRDLYAARPETGAVLHAHSPFAVSLACLRREIPPFHYMIARFGGDTVRCGAYALFGSQALSDAALVALEGRSACLLANHGMLVCGRDLKQALDLGVELESLCEQYWRAALLGEPVLLNAAEMTAVLERFEGYGQQGQAPKEINTPRSP